MQTPEADADQIFTELMSPFCPGLTLADCPSPNAFDLRGEIRRRLKAGESRQAIERELVAKYGVQILADPSDTPIGRVVWGVPMGVAAAAAVGLAWFVRRATRVAQAERAVAAVDAETSKRLDEELADLD